MKIETAAAIDTTGKEDFREVAANVFIHSDGRILVTDGIEAIIVTPERPATAK
jgi:hypothetical protein